MFLTLILLFLQLQDKLLCAIRVDSKEGLGFAQSVNVGWYFIRGIDVQVMDVIVMTELIMFINYCIVNYLIISYFLL